MYEFIFIALFFGYKIKIQSVNEIVLINNGLKILT